MTTPARYARRTAATTVSAVLLTLTFASSPGTAQEPTNGEIAFAKASEKSGAIDVYTAQPGGDTRLIRNANFPAWSPGSTSIAFVRITRKGGRDIFVQQIGAKKATQLTFNPGDDVSPDWSPDGSQIAWSRDNDIWVMNANGTGEHLIQDAASANSPTWTPDGRILYGSTVDGSFDVHIMNADGTGDVSLTGGPGDQSDEQKPHSNGTTIVFAKRPSGQTDFELWRMDAAGENEELLFDTPSIHDDHPRWSPDGNWIAFECDISNDFDQDICVLTGNGSSASEVSGRGPDARPDWGEA
jgi:Tol biopolymer transport system component